MFPLARKPIDHQNQKKKKDKGNFVPEKEVNAQLNEFKMQIKLLLHCIYIPAVPELY